MAGAASTYVRFIPRIKKNYDYGVMIFLLTFNLITVSSFRMESVWSIAKDRVSTIAIGCGLCLLMSLLVFPNWSGEDLHNSTISKLEGLARSIEVCVVEYFCDSDKQVMEDESSEDPIYKGYKAVLDSKATDETLALQASWEPRYSRYCHRIPWQQYVKVSAALRHFSYTVVALHGCLQTEIKTPMSVRALYKDSCIMLANEVSKVLRELACSIEKNRHFSSEILSNSLSEALEELNTALNSQSQLFLGSRSFRTPNTPDQDRNHKQERFSGELTKEVEKKDLRPQLSKMAANSIEFSEALPLAAFTSLLVEMVAKLDHVMDEVEQLGRLAHFREFGHDEEVVVTCERLQNNVADNYLPSYGAE